MSSPTPIVAPPAALEYLLYGTFGMLCLAITIGVIILMRRHATRDQMTGVGEIDYPKIAAQLQKEIERLQALRDRIYPEGAANVAIAEANRPLGISIGEQGASAASMSAEDLRALPEVQNILSAEIAVITKKHEEALVKAQTTGGGVSAAAAANPAAEAEIASLKAEIETLRAKPATASAPENNEVAQKLEAELKGLKERLQEYEIFEEDLSRVKELTKENEDLKKRLGGGAGATVAPAAVAAVAAAPVAPAAPVSTPVVEKESADSSSELRTSSESAKQDIDEGAYEAAVESQVPEESEETSADQVTAEFEKLLSGGGDSIAAAPAAAAAAAPAAAPAEIPKGFEAESVGQEPGIGTLPADDLMAEFEKLLGGEKGT